MLISHKYKFIFIHNPRTGGTNVTRALLPFLGEDVIQATHGFPYNNHMSASDLWKRIPPDIWRDYFIFVFVRNPWDKMVSHYHYFSQTYDMEQILPNFHVQFNETFSSFNEWLLHFYQGEKKRNWRDYFNYFASGILRQEGMTYRMWVDAGRLSYFGNARVILDSRGNPLVDHIGRFENLVGEFDAICERMHISAALSNRNRNKSNHGAYGSYYTEETAAIVGDFFKEEIELFGYHFHQ